MRPLPFSAAGPPVLGIAAFLLLAGCVAAEPAKSTGPATTSPPGTGSTAGLSVGMIALLVVMVLAVAAAGFWAGSRSRRAPIQQAPDPQLLTGLIGSHDLTVDDALRGHIEQVLHRVGVLALRPTAGSQIADARIEVVGSTPAPSRRLVGAVAEVLRVGWVDGGVLVRPAQVLVFAEPEPEPESRAVPPGPNDHGEPYR